MAYNDYRQLVDAFDDEGYEEQGTGEQSLRAFGSTFGITRPPSGFRYYANRAAAAALTPAWTVVRRVVGEKPYDYEGVARKKRDKALEGLVVGKWGGEKPKSLPAIETSVLQPRMSTKTAEFRQFFPMPSRKQNPPSGRFKPIPIRRGRSSTVTSRVQYPQVVMVQAPKPSRGRAKSIPGRPKSTIGKRTKSAPARQGNLKNAQRLTSATTYGSSGGVPVIVERKMPLAKMGRMDKTHIPVTRLWDESIYAMYPVAGAGNFLVMGGDINSCCNEYPLALWSGFYTPGPVYAAGRNYSWFRYKNWEIEYVPFVGSLTGGEIIFINARDMSKLYNKGLTFSCANLDRGAFGQRVVVSDYKGITGGLTWGTNFSVEAKIKQWSEVRPVEYSVYMMKGFTHKMYGRKNWLRNAVPAGGNPDGFYDFYKIDVPEADKAIGGCLCMWGTVNNDFQATEANTLVKVADLFQHADIEIKGLGTTDTFDDYDPTAPERLTLSDRKIITRMCALASRPDFIEQIQKGLAAQGWTHPELNADFEELKGEIQSGAVKLAKSSDGPPRAARVEKRDSIDGELVDLPSSQPPVKGPSVSFADRVNDNVTSGVKSPTPGEPSSLFSSLYPRGYGPKKSSSNKSSTSNP